VFRHFYEDNFVEGPDLLLRIRGNSLMSMNNTDVFGRSRKIGRRCQEGTSKFAYFCSMKTSISDPQHSEQLDSFKMRPTNNSHEILV
jgi:hypothetical protein